jgi:hypothetical protein
MAPAMLRGKCRRLASGQEPVVSRRRERLTGRRFSGNHNDDENLTVDRHTVQEMVMEILLLISIIAVAASGLYVAVTLNIRIERSVKPLINKAAQDVDGKIDARSAELKQQIKEVADDLRQDRELVKRIEATDTDIRWQVQTITDELQRHGGVLAKHLEKLVETRHEQLKRDLLQLDHHVAQLRQSLDQQSESLARQNDSLARQGAQITEIHNHAKSGEKQSENPAKIDSVTLAMLEAESHVDGEGWGQPPRLYVLKKRTSSTEEDRELAAERGAAGPGALMLVEGDPLPDGNLIEVIGGIRWPEDVVGCVLVTELVSLPPGGEDGALVDPIAARQWASTHPDGRPARLAVGVCRNGEYACGLRINGDDVIQIRTGLAEGVVTALRGTF